MDYESYMDHEFLLLDRIDKIQAINKQYDLENNSYIAFSGGKDSTILHYLIDMALPNNKIPRVYINTGIEFVDMVKFVKELAKTDDRIIIVSPKKSIKNVLKEYGYPFKNKSHSLYLKIYQHSGKSKYIDDYINGVNKVYKCAKYLKYQFTQDFKIKVSENCCIKIKENPSKEWSKQNNKTINITGIRNSEGGVRMTINNCVFVDKKGVLKKFHPLLIVSDDWEDWFIKTYNIKLCKLYYPPYNFRRTGCKGCPYSLTLQKDLDTMAELLPNERRQCEIIWKPVYAEYRRLGYRLKYNLFDLDFIKE